MSDKNNKRKSPAKHFKSEEEESFQTFCNQMLQTRVFRGCYQERRYVEHLKKYRDLIVVDREENDLIKDLEYVKNRIVGEYKNKNLWSGITLPNMIGAPAAGVCIWTEITNVPLGEHWFYIKSVKFRDNEVKIKLTQVRSEDSEGSFTATRMQNNSNMNDENDIPTLNDYFDLMNTWKNNISAVIYTFLAREINKENITSTVKFLSLLIISLFTFSIEAIKFTGIFTLKFMFELRQWVHTCTPIILMLIELITKIIGGFYILLAMLWRDVFNPNSQNANVNYNQLPPANNAPRYLTSGREYYRNLHGNRHPDNRKNIY